MILPILLLHLLFFCLLVFGPFLRVPAEAVVEVVDKRVGRIEVIESVTSEPSLMSRLITFTGRRFCVLADLFMTHVIPYWGGEVGGSVVIEPRIMDLSQYPEVPAAYRRGPVTVPLDLGFNYQRLP